MGIVSKLLDLVWWIIRPFLVYLRKCWDSTIRTGMSLAIIWKRKISLPPVFNPILMLPAVTLAELIRQRKLKSVEVVRAFIMRISDINPILNAMVQENFQRALDEARKVDHWIEESYMNGTVTPEALKEEQPFLGVPFTVKETVAVEDFPHTAGLLAREKCIAVCDAEVVERLRDAGAVLLGTTNVSELGMWWECSNPLYGRTNNPYDTRRTSGGSSGGEAALVCGCGSAISIGSDIGGSIRTPAFFCGLFGHKPSVGLVSNRGCNVHGYNEGIEDTLQVVGPISRFAVDLAPILALLAGENAEKLHLSEPVHISRLKVYSIEGDSNGILTSSVDPVLLQTQRDICKHFYEEYDITVHRVHLPELRRSFWIWQEKYMEDYPEEKPIYQQLVDNKGEINIFTELCRLVLFRARYSFPSLLQAAREKIYDEVDFLKTQRRVLQGSEKNVRPKSESRWRKLKMRLQRLLADDGILLYPSHPTQAPYHRESYYHPLNFTYTAIFNALGFPVTQVPLGLDSIKGLPIGIQVVAGMNQDRLTIAVAKELENKFGGWRCPAKIL